MATFREKPSARRELMVGTIERPSVTAREPFYMRAQVGASLIIVARRIVDTEPELL